MVNLFVYCSSKLPKLLVKLIGRVSDPTQAELKGYLEHCSKGSK